MNIHCFQHVEFEGPGMINDWVESKKQKLHFTHFHKGDPLPDLNSVDLLIVMGGPMDVYDYHIHSWMEDEIAFVKQCIENNTPVLGICLGAQIVAAALGSEVYPGKEKEIGWFPVTFLPAAGDFKIWSEHPGTRMVFHWHGDTFDIPEGAIRIARSNAFQNQGFIYNNRVMAFQFHLEVTPELVKGLTKHCGDELIQGKYIQDARTIINQKDYYSTNHKQIYQVLDYLEKMVREPG